MKEIPKEFFDELDKTTPEHIKKIVREAVVLFLTKLDVSEEEADEFTNKIMTRRFSEMFGLIDGYSVTNTRKLAKEEGKEEGREEGREEMKIEIAKELILQGIDIDKIVNVTKLGYEKISEIKENLQVIGN